MRAYSVDLRMKIVGAVQRGRSKAEVAHIFGVGISSVKRYMKMTEEKGSVDPKKAPGKKRKLDEGAMKLLQEDLRARPTATYEQRATFLDALLSVRVSKSTICRAIKRLGYTRKKDRWALVREMSGSGSKPSAKAESRVGGSAMGIPSGADRRSRRGRRATSDCAAFREFGSEGGSIVDDPTRCRKCSLDRPCSSITWYRVDSSLLIPKHALREGALALIASLKLCRRRADKTVRELTKRKGGQG